MDTQNQKRQTHSTTEFNGKLCFVYKMGKDGGYLFYSDYDAYDRYVEQYNNPCVLLYDPVIGYYHETFNNYYYSS